MGSRPLNIRRKILAYTLVLSAVLVGTLMRPISASAAAGVNQQINFQGRLLNAQGATVPDGFYNIQFKIYQDGDGLSAGDTTGSPAGSLKWTENYLNSASQGVTVKNGFLSVQLGSINPFGSSVNWNSDTLWLSMNVGSTNVSCTPFTACTPDGEMTPLKRLSSTPYSLNSGALGGLSSAQFVQLAQGVQIDSGTGTTSIFINKTGTGSLLDLQSAGTDVFVLSNTGDVTFGSNADHTLAIATAGAGVAGKGLGLSAGAAGTGGTALAGGNLTLAGGAGGGTNGNGGSVSIDAGVRNGTGTDGTISLGTTTASGVNIAKTGVLTAIGGSLTVASTINSATISGGSLSSTTVNAFNVSANALSAGTGALTIDANTTNTISIGGISAGNVLLAGGKGSTGCTVNNGNGNFDCDGTINGATITGGNVSGGTISGGTLSATAVNGFNVSATALAVAAAATSLTIDAGTTGTISIGGTSTGNVLLGGGSGATGCTVTNATGAFACTGTINGATISGGTLTSGSYSGATITGGTLSAGTFSGGTVSGGSLTATAVNSLNVGGNAISTASGNLSVDANGTGSVSIGSGSTGDILLGGGSGSTGCTVTNANGNYVCSGTINGATITGGTLSAGSFTGGSVSAGTFSGGTVSGGSLTATAVNSLNVGGNAISTASGNLSVDANGTGSVSVGGTSTGNVLLAGGAGATGCTINNGNGSLTCDSTINGATLSGGTLSGGTVSGGTLTATAVNSLNVGANAISTASGSVTFDANGANTISIGSISTGDILLGGGVGSTGCTITNSNGNFACTGTINGATISGGSLTSGSFSGATVTGGTLSGGTFSGGSVSGGSLTATAVNSLNVGANAISTASGNLSVDAFTTGTISLGSGSSGDILLGGGSASTGCTITNASGNYTCSGTINGATISGGTLSAGSFTGGSVSAGTLSGGTVSGGSLTATAVNSLNVGANAISTASGNLSVDANGTGSVSIAGTSTGNVNIAGGFGATGCSINNGNGNFVCDGTINGATLSGGTLSGGTVSGGTLTATAVNSLNVGANAISTASGAIAIDANGANTISLGSASTGDILLGGGVGATGCTITNSNGNFACTGTINSATISGGNFSGGTVSGGTLSAGSFTGGSVSGGSLTATTVNTLIVGANAIATAAGNLSVDANTTGTISLGSGSTGDILLGGGSAATGCTVTNVNGNFACTGTINGATISGGTVSGGSLTGGSVSAGTFSGGTVSGGSLTATTVNGLNVSGTALSVVAAATGLTVDAGTTGNVSIGSISSGNILFGGGQGSTGCTVNNGNGNFSCDGTINNATISGGTFSGGSVTGGSLTATAVNTLLVGANAIATAAGNLSVDANGTGTVNIGNLSTGDVLIAGGSAATGCTVANASGNLTCTGTVNGATISGGTLSAGSFTGGSVSAGTFSGGTVSGGSLTATTVNGINVGANAISTTSGNLSLDANLTGTVSIASGSTGDVLIGGGNAATGCTLTNVNGNYACSGTITAGSGLTVLGGGMNVTGLATLNTGLSLAAGATFTNASSTLNTAVAISDKPTGGAIGTAAATVDVATAFTVNQVTSGQTLSIPSPTTTTAGRLIYISNIGSQSFILLGTTVSTGTSATLIWNGTAWTFGGADGSSILNQSAADQTANFRVSGTGQANTAFLTPLLDTATAVALNIGTTNASVINLNENTTVATGKTLTIVNGLTSLTSSTGDALNVSNSTGTGNIAVFKDNNTAVATIGDNGATTFKPSTNSTSAFQVQPAASTTAVLDVDTVNNRIGINTNTPGATLEINSGAANTSGIRFTQLTSTSTGGTSFTGILGLDTSGNVGLSQASVSLTSPALAYWDGLANPTVTGQSYPLATLSGVANYSGAANGVQLTSATGNQSGSVNWNFSQVPFEEIQFQMKAGGGSGADGTWFYSYADGTPTTEFGTGMTKGYIIYFSEFHDCVGITYGAYTDGNQCIPGGAGKPLAQVAKTNIDDGNFHDVDIQILYNKIIVRWDGVPILSYSDIYTRDTSNLNFGFGARTGGSTNNHYIKNLLVTKLGTNVSQYNTANINPLASDLYWDNVNKRLGIGTTAPNGQFQVGTGFSADSTNGVQIGSATTDTTQLDLQLDSSSTFTDVGTCTTTSNQGALYYNTASNAIRSCVNGAWEDVMTTSGLGLIAFGVLPDTGPTPGDLVGASGVTNSPCKATRASATTIAVSACTVYSQGRKLVYAGSTLGTTFNGTLWYHICFSSASTSPTATTGNASETGAMPTFSANNPVLCIADIKTTTGSISQIYDTRVFTTSVKSFATVNSAAPLGTIVKQSTSGLSVLSTTANDAATGIVVASSGAASSTTPNAIIVTSGAVYVKALTASTVGQFVLPSTTTGYSTTTTSVVPSTPYTVAYNLLGVAQSTIATSCTTQSTAASNCQTSQFIQMSVR